VSRHGRVAPPSRFIARECRIGIRNSQPRSSRVGSLRPRPLRVKSSHVNRRPNFARRMTIGQKGAAARWSDEIKQAAHGSEDHPLKIGDIEIPCYVLADETRVLAPRGVMSGLNLGRGSGAGSGGDRLQRFVTGKTISPFVSRESLEVIENPIRFGLRREGALPLGKRTCCSTSPARSGICSTSLTDPWRSVLEKPICCPPHYITSSRECRLRATDRKHAALLNLKHTPCPNTDLILL
jgi:hypothetical protein